MKKFFYFLTGIFFFSVFTFTACKNFFNTTDLVDTLGNAISYANSPAFSVKIAPDNPKHGTVLSENIKDGVKVTDSFEVEFTVNDDFTFLGWDAVNKDDTSISYTDFVSFEDPHSLSTVATIIGGNDEIYKGQLQIRPACRAITKGTVAILSITGISSISYNTTAEYKEGTKLDLRVTTQPQYQFTHWQVQIDGEIVNSTEFVSFENINNAETIATFKKRPDSGATVSIVPVLVLRPKVIIKTPDNPASGAYKDTRINYFFNAEMDESSIYYSTEEKSKIDADSFLENDEVTWGYIKDKQIYFKNIEISDVYNKINLLEYFDKPFFASEEQLVIPLKNGITLPVGKTVIVNLSSAFVSKTDDNFFISLNPDNTDLHFTVADKEDYYSPTIGAKVKSIGPVMYKREIKQETSYSITTEIKERDAPIWDDTSNLSEIAPVKQISSFNTSFTDDIENKKKYYAKNNIIYLEIDVTDDGSGPASLTYTLYNPKTKEKSEEITLTAPGTGTPISYKDTITLPDSGFSFIQFHARDIKNLRASTEHYPIYFEKPDPAKINIDKINFSFTPDTTFITLDISVKPTCNVYYKYKKTTETEYSTPQEIYTLSSTFRSTLNITGLSEATTYDFLIFPVDEFGYYDTDGAINTTVSTKPKTPTIN